MCEQITKNKSGICSKDDLCQYSHNYVEMLYRPSKYKSKFCDKYPHHINECEYGPYCSFAHSVSEISVPLIHTL
jgi:hypothetical protein